MISGPVQAPALAAKLMLACATISKISMIMLIIILGRKGVLTGSPFPRQDLTGNGVDQCYRGEAYTNDGLSADEHIHVLGPSSNATPGE